METQFPLIDVRDVELRFRTEIGHWMIRTKSKVQDADFKPPSAEWVHRLGRTVRFQVPLNLYT